MLIYFILWGFGPAVLHRLLDGPAELLLESRDDWLLTVLLNLGRIVMVLAATIVAARWIDRRPFADYGFHIDARWWGDFSFGLLLGALLMGAIFAVEVALGWVTIDAAFVSYFPTAAFFPAILAPLMRYIAVALAEELLTRSNQTLNMAEGFAFLARPFHILLAWLLSSIFFGLLHYANPNATFVSTTNLLLIGIFFGVGYVVTGQLAIPLGLHLTWNFFQGNIFGFPVSGATNTNATLIAITQQGPDFWTGGAFGPEGGMLGVIAVLVGSLAVISWVRFRTGSVTLSRLPLLIGDRQLK
jgi:membrane protease YdiL (CAAX protease family)